MADWQKIKTEYITGDASIRELAQKHGVNRATVGKKAKDEKWVELRRQHRDRTLTKTLNADTKQKVDRATRLKTVADKLLDKVEALVADDDYLSAAAIKNLSDALKNIKEAQMIRTQEDIDEQKARITKLQNEAHKVDSEKSITITLEGSLSDYAQ